MVQEGVDKFILMDNHTCVVQWSFFLFTCWGVKSAIRPVHNMMLHNVLHCIAFMLMLVAMQLDARIDLDSILAFLCVGFLYLIAKKLLTNWIRNFLISQINTTQGLVSHCELAYRDRDIRIKVGIFYHWGLMDDFNDTCTQHERIIG